MSLKVVIKKNDMTYFCSECDLCCFLSVLASALLAHDHFNESHKQFDTIPTLALYEFEEWYLSLRSPIYQIDLLG